MDLFTILSNTFISISSNFFIYRHPLPVLNFPSFFRSLAALLMSVVRYSVRFALRGEKPILNHSTSLPVAGLLYMLFLKPIIEEPHILGLLPDAFCIILSMV